MPTHEFRVTITTGETAAEASDFIKEAVGDAFGCEPEELIVAHVRTLPEPPPIPEPGGSDARPTDCPPNLDGDEPECEA